MYIYIYIHIYIYYVHWPVEVINTSGGGGGGGKHELYIWPSTAYHIFFPSPLDTNPFVFRCPVNITGFHRLHSIVHIWKLSFNWAINCQIAYLAVIYPSSCTLSSLLRFMSCDNSEIIVR